LNKENFPNLISEEDFSKKNRRSTIDFSESTGEGALEQQLEEESQKESVEEKKPPRGVPMPGMMLPKFDPTSVKLNKTPNKQTPPGAVPMPGMGMAFDPTKVTLRKGGATGTPKNEPKQEATQVDFRNLLKKKENSEQDH